MSCQIVPAQTAVADLDISGQRKTCGVVGFGRTRYPTPGPGQIDSGLIEKNLLDLHFAGQQRPPGQTQHQPLHLHGGLPFRPDPQTL